MSNAILGGRLATVEDVADEDEVVEGAEGGNMLDSGEGSVGGDEGVGVWKGTKCVVTIRSRAFL
jgi:hypothetical protein